MVVPKYILLSLLAALAIAAPFPSEEAIGSVEVADVADVAFDAEQQRPKGSGVCIIFMPRLDLKLTRVQRVQREREVRCPSPEAEDSPRVVAVASQVVCKTGSSYATAELSLTNTRRYGRRTKVWRRTKGWWKRYDDPMSSST
jgi:hypothetical protein